MRMNADGGSAFEATGLVHNDGVCDRLGIFWALWVSGAFSLSRCPVCRLRGSSVMLPNPPAQLFWNFPP